MNIFTIFAIILGGIIALASSAGIALGILATILYKIYRKIRYGISIFD